MPPMSSSTGSLLIANHGSPIRSQYTRWCRTFCSTISLFSLISSIPARRVAGSFTARRGVLGFLPTGPEPDAPPVRSVSGRFP